MERNRSIRAENDHKVELENMREKAVEETLEQVRLQLETEKERLR